MSVAAQRVLYVAEPPAIWLQRLPVVVDCSVLAAIVFGETSCEEAAGLLGDKAVHAPSLLPYEMANVARSKQRSGLDATVVDAALQEFAVQRLVLHAVAAEAMLALAQRYGLSAYDAAYLSLAAELKAPLATFDRLLADAARQHLGALD